MRITIEKVGNGYIIHYKNGYEPGSAELLADIKVAASFIKLIGILRQLFAEKTRNA